MIAAKVANALALDYPRELLEVIVACDGSPDATAERRARRAPTSCSKLPRGGKIRAQDAAVERARGEIVAFSDANALWEPDALRGCSWRRSPTRRVGYVCGQVRFVNDGGTNQEGLYWRYEIGVRALESRLASVTAGNGAIYATRRDAYIEVDPVMGHDLSFPFNMVKRGLARGLRARRRARPRRWCPSIEGEFARKRRMMSHAWPIVLRGGMLSPRGYPPLYALMIVSHRLLRYAVAVPARRRARRATSRSCWPTAPVYVVDARRSRRRSSLAALLAPRGPRAAAADRPLLRADHRLARRRAVGLAAPRERRPAGSRPEGTR